MLSMQVGLQHVKYCIAISRHLQGGPDQFLLVAPKRVLGDHEGWGRQLVRAVPEILVPLVEVE